MAALAIEYSPLALPAFWFSAQTHRLIQTQLNGCRPTGRSYFNRTFREGLCW